jgi:molecular chaperone HscB
VRLRHVVLGLSASAALTMESSAPPALCPGCGQPPGSTLACLQCGRVLEEPAGATHFQRLGAPAAAGVDRAALERTYLRLSRLLHPDFHGGADARLLDLAVANSALLNEAYALLGDDEARAEYLLSLHDAGALERWKALPPAFLAEAMERSEAVEEAAASGDRAVLARLAADARDEIAARRAQLGDPQAWAPPDTRRLATLLHELRVFRRILRDAEAAA